MNEHHIGKLIKHSIILSLMTLPFTSDFLIVLTLITNAHQKTDLDDAKAQVLLNGFFLSSFAFSFVMLPMTSFGKSMAHALFEVNTQLRVNFIIRASSNTPKFPFSNYSDEVYLSAKQPHQWWRRRRLWLKMFGEGCNNNNNNNCD